MAKSYENLLVVHLPNYVVNVQLNRPKQLNAISLELWQEIGDVFRDLATDAECRVIILSGNGRAFTTGIDLNRTPMSLLSDGEDTARTARTFLPIIFQLQAAFTAIEECPKPVIAAMHGWCLGIGIDIISACDIRHATVETLFSIKEVDLGLASDVGVLNRLPHIVGASSWMREKAYSTRNFKAEEALKNDLISAVYPTQEAMMSAVLQLANEIASKSPVAVQGTKVVLNYARDHTVKDSLNFVAMWNMSQLQTEDIAKAAMAALTKDKKPIEFSKL